MKITVFLALLFACINSFAQGGGAKFPALNDSAFQADINYQRGNKYQRDAMIFVDMLVNTHPYYIKKERRDSLLATQPALLKACGECTSDSTFTQLLYGVLGKLHDKHTDIIDMQTYNQLKQKMQAKKSAVNQSDKGSIMAYGGDLFHYQIFPELSICYLQFNSCQDARTTGNQSLPRWDTMLNEMFSKLEDGKIQTLVVDVQYNSGGNSMLCDELFMHISQYSSLKNFTSFIRYSNLMGAFYPNILNAKKSWEEEGHTDELYQVPEVKFEDNFIQPEIYKGKVVFVQSQKTFSSAGMLIITARDNHIGEIIGQTSSYSPSHYGDIIPFSLPNTGEFGSVSTKFFARPDITHVDASTLEPDIKLDLEDKTATWNWIVNTYSKHNSDK